jgi:hypothetical protein
MKIFVSLLLVGIILLGCSENQRTSPKLDFVSYNKEKGILLIDNKKLNGKKLKVIEILSNSDIQKQSIFVDSNLTCYRISNFKNVFWKKWSKCFYKICANLFQKFKLKNKKYQVSFNLISKH